MFGLLLAQLHLSIRSDIYVLFENINNYCFVIF